MNIEIITTYQIEFQKVFFMGGFVKIVNSPHSFLNQLISETNSEEEINDTLLAIDLVLNGTHSHLPFVTNSMLIVDIFSTLSKFYDTPDFNGGTPTVYTIPTLDLKEILLSWKEF